MKKDIKDLKIGESFRFEIPNPKGHLILKIQSIESDTKIPWCLVTGYRYDEPAEDEYEEEDRYKTGDTMPHVYGGLVEVIDEDELFKKISQTADFLHRLQVRGIRQTCDAFNESKKKP